MRNFFEPKVLKDNSSLETKLDSLKRFPITNSDEIYKLKMGIEGEKQVLYHLTKSNIGMYILRDINLEIDGLRAQIDFVVVTSHHCYFIEVKNYAADIIYIDENRNFEISTKYKQRYRRKGIKSPLSQADDQLRVFKRLYLKDKEKNNEIFNEIQFDDYFKTMVVFTNQGNRLENKKAPQDIKYRVLKVDNLIKQIEYDELHYKDSKLSQNKMLEIANYFLNNAKDKKFEISNDLPIVAYEKSLNFNNYTIKPKKNNKEVLPIIILCTVSLALWGLVFVISDKNVTSSSGYNNNQTNNTVPSGQKTRIGKETVPTETKKVMTDNNIMAINSLKQAYDNSKEYGFDLYDYNKCIYLKEILSDSFICTGSPMQVTFSNNNLSIYHNYNCYYLEYNIQNKTVVDSSSKYVGYEKQCLGIDVGLIHYDSNNQFLNKVGGYNKLLEMARLAHNETTGFEKYFDYSHVEERGGRSTLAMTYKSKVENYFRTMVGKGYLSATNSLDDFNQMIESYYYVMNNSKENN